MEEICKFYFKSFYNVFMKTNAKLELVYETN